MSFQPTSSTTQGSGFQSDEHNWLVGGVIFWESNNSKTEYYDPQNVITFVKF